MRITKSQLLKEIRANGGNLSEIAHRYGLTYNAIHKRIKSDPQLTEALAETREGLVDLAQAQLVRAVRDGAAWAVKFTLETWGKHRGFSKRVEVVEPEASPHVIVQLPDNGRTRTA
jgi:hypothetical protein